MSTDDPKEAPPVGLLDIYNRFPLIDVVARPRQVRRLTLSFASGEVLMPGEQRTFQKTPRTAFRAQRLLVNTKGHGRDIRYAKGSKSRRKGRLSSIRFYAMMLRNPDPFIDVVDIRVGTISQFAVPTGVPAAFFSPAGSLPDLNIDVARTEMTISIALANCDTQPITVVCAMIGREAI